MIPKEINPVRNSPSQDPSGAQSAGAISNGVKVLSVCFFIIFFSYNGVQQFITPYFSDLNIVKVGFWSLILIYFSLLVTNLFSGFIVSKLGVKKCLIFGSLFYSLFIFVLITKNPGLVYLASIFLGFGAAILWTAQGTFLIRASDSKHYGKSSGFFSTFQMLGSVLGIVAISLLITRLDYKYSFLILAVVSLAAGAVFLTVKNVELRTVDFRNRIQAFKKIITNPTALKFFLIWFSFSLIIASVSGRFPLEIKKYFGLGSIGFITPIFYFLPLIFAYRVGKESDIKGRKLFLIFAYIFVLSGLIMFMLQTQFGLGKAFFVLSFLLVSLGFALFFPVARALLGDISSDSNLEYLAAFSILASNSGYVIIFLLNMYLPAIFSYLIPFLIILSSLIIILPVLKLNISVIKERINNI